MRDPNFKKYPGKISLPARLVADYSALPVSGSYKPLNGRIVANPYSQKR